MVEEVRARAGKRSKSSESSYRIGKKALEYSYSEGRLDRASLHSKRYVLQPSPDKLKGRG